MVPSKREPQILQEIVICCMRVSLEHSSTNATRCNGRLTVKSLDTYCGKSTKALLVVTLQQFSRPDMIFQRRAQVQWATKSKWLQKTEPVPC